MSKMKRQRKEHLEQLQEAVACAAPYLNYGSHYDVSRCCRQFWETIRTHYAVSRSLDARRGWMARTDLHRLRQEAVRHVVGDRGLEALEELKYGLEERDLGTWIFQACTPGGLKALSGGGGPYCGVGGREMLPVEVPPDAMSGLRKVELICNDAIKFYQALFENCRPPLEELRMNTPRFDVPGSVPVSAAGLRKVELQGDHAADCFASFSESCAPALEELRIWGCYTEFAGQAVGDFRRLRKLALNGDGANGLFASISATCAANLEELVILHGGEAGEGMKDFRKLRKVDLEGRGVSRLLKSLESCGPTLEELRMIEPPQCSANNHQEVAEEAVGDFPRLRKLELNGGRANRLFASLSATCAANLEELDITCFECFAGEVVRDFRRLRKVNLEGRGVSRLLRYLQSCASTLEELSMKETTTLQVTEEVAGDFRRLRKLTLYGFCNFASWFASISATCAASLQELNIMCFGSLAGEVAGDFRRLRKVNLEGISASKWFGSFAGSRTPALEELRISEMNQRCFVRNPVGDFPRLRKVELTGSYASRWFSSISESCDESLEELSITEVKEFVGEVRGDDLPRLGSLILKGRGAIEWFSSISERCAPMLETLRIYERLQRHPTEVSGNFKRLIKQDFYCTGFTLSECRMKPVDSRGVYGSWTEP